MLTNDLNGTVVQPAEVDDRVRVLSAQIQAGTYVVPTEQLADVLLPVLLGGLEAPGSAQKHAEATS